MEIMEKVAYLKGLAEGLSIDETTKEGKLFNAMIDLLDDIALTISEMSEGFALVSEELEQMEEDMEEVLDELFGQDEGGMPGDLDDFEGELYEVVCPACTDSICVDEDMLDEGAIACPGCGNSLEFDFDGEPEENQPRNGQNP